MVDERPKYNFPRKMLDVSIGSVHGLFFQIRTIFYLTL